MSEGWVYGVERTDHGAQVADSDLQGVGSGALGLAADVDGGPAEGQGDGWVDACGGEEGADVGDAGSLSWVLVCEEDDVADDGDGGEAGDEDGAALEFLAGDCDGDGQECGQDVWWDRQELCVGLSLIHI